MFKKKLSLCKLNKTMNAFVVMNLIEKLNQYIHISTFRSMEVILIGPFMYYFLQHKNGLLSEPLMRLMNIVFILVPTLTF